MLNYRSNCPLARALDLIGDKWTLLILRETVAFQKSTFKELVAIPEKISTNILTDRLVKMVEEGLLIKTQSRDSKLVFHYRPTQKAIDLMPVAQELAKWSMKYQFEEGEEVSADFKSQIVPSSA